MATSAIRKFFNQFKEKRCLLGIPALIYYAVGLIYGLAAIFTYFQFCFGSGARCEPIEESMYKDDETKTTMKENFEKLKDTCRSSGEFYYHCDTGQRYEVNYYNYIPLILVIEAFLYCVPVHAFDHFMKSSRIQPYQLITEVVGIQEDENYFDEFLKKLASRFVQGIHSNKNSSAKKYTFPLCWISVKIYQIHVGVFNSFLFFIIIAKKPMMSFYFPREVYCSVDDLRVALVCELPAVFTFYNVLRSMGFVTVIVYLYLFRPFMNSLIDFYHYYTWDLPWDLRCSKDELVRRLARNRKVMKKFKNFIGIDGILAMKFLDKQKEVNNSAYFKFVTAVFLQFVQISLDEEQKASDFMRRVAITYFSV